MFLQSQISVEKLLLISYLLTDFFGLWILITIYCFMRRKYELFTTDQKIFSLILLFNALLLIFDAGMWAFDGKTYTGAKFLNSLSTFLYFLSQGVMCYGWFVYLNYRIHNNFDLFKRRIIIYIIPFILATLLTIVSLFNGCIFKIDENNIYRHGPLLIIYVLLIYVYFVSSSIIVVFKRKEMKRKDVIPLAIYPIPAIIASVIQLFAYGVNIIWVTSAISALILFISLQNTSLNTDYLTGLFNRRYMERILRYKLSNGSRKYVAGVMLDINKFKKINDEFGHLEGDNALEDVSRVLLVSCSKSDIVSRYAGDEFVIITETTKKDYIINLIDLIEKNISDYNTNSNKPYKITFSTGYRILEPNEKMTFDQFLSIIDMNMYEQKENNRK